MRVGQIVLFKQADDEGPWTGLNLRVHPALVANVHANGMLDLVVIPFGCGWVSSISAVAKYEKESTDRCWLPVELGSIE